MASPDPGVVTTAWPFFPIFAGVFAYGITTILAGMYFTGIDATPPDKVGGITIPLVIRYCGIIILLAAFFCFWYAWSLMGKEAGVTLGWIGSIFGLFSIFYFFAADNMAKGGDLKPFAWFLLILAVILIPYTIQTSTILAPFPNLKLDLTILLGIVVIGCILCWLGIRFKPSLLRYGGIAFILTGCSGLEIGIRYLFASLGIGSF